MKHVEAILVRLIGLISNWSDTGHRGKGLVTQGIEIIGFEAFNEVFE